MLSPRYTIRRMSMEDRSGSCYKVVETFIFDLDYVSFVRQYGAYWLSQPSVGLWNLVSRVWFLTPTL